MNLASNLTTRSVRFVEELDNVRIAVLIPCYNEALTIGKVIKSFRHSLPFADIYVFDNNSTDDTVAEAIDAGAIVRRENQQGKGHVIRRMFRDIEADFYVIVDGDDTYDAAIALDMIKTAMTGPYDLVNCVRRETTGIAYRAGHRLGNKLLTGVVRSIFGNRVTDMLSGYKVLSKRFVKSFPTQSDGFDVETELTVHSLQLSMPVAHVEGNYGGRPEGSTSKLNTYRDGLRISRLILRLIRHERPVLFFGVISAVLASLSFVIAAPIVGTYIESGTVPRFPSAFLAMGIMLLAALNFLTGLVLDTVSRGRKELRMLAYLQHPAPPQTTIHNSHSCNTVLPFVAPPRLKAPQSNQRSFQKQILRFVIVGFFGYLVNAGLVELLALTAGPILAQAIAFPAAVSLTWWLNRHYTFGASAYPARQEWFRYIFASTLGWAANNGVYIWFILSYNTLYQHPSLAVAGGSLAGMLFNFSFSRWLVFRPDYGSAI